MVENRPEHRHPTEGRRTHMLAERARETGNSLDALKYTDKALLAYQSEGNKLGMAEILSSRSITFRRLYKQTQDPSYLTLAKHTSHAAVDIAKESGNPTARAIPLFQLANVQEMLGEFPEAANTYQQAVENITTNPPETHNRPAVVADFKIHMTTCEYKAGDTSALERAEAAIAELKVAEEPDSYAKDVWLSGGYMRIAEIVKTDNPEKAREALRQAKEIIDNNPQLELRKKDYDALAATF
jgi:tetratricopeptide (TPR) repeat protein